jgi:DNA-binding MarR family transcriptional regulator
MGDGFTRDVCGWLLQIAEDATLPDSCCRLANVLALKYMNRKKRCAWPTVPTLAKILGVTTRAVTNQIGRLVEAGHLQVDHDRGRGHANFYRWRLKQAENRPGAEVLEKGESRFRQDERERGISVRENRNGDVIKT